MTDREKIIEIIKSNEKAFFEEKVIKGNSIHDNEFAERLADALIENGYGNVAEWKRRAEKAERDVKEWKRRAEVAERAVKIAATRLKCYGGLGEGFCAVSDCEYRHCGNDEGCVLVHLRKAEREIEEEQE